MFRKILKKITAFILSLSIIGNIFAPLSVLAIGREINIGFAGSIEGTNVTYNINDKSVIVAINNHSLSNNIITIDEDEIGNAFTFTGFDPDTMQIKLEADDGFSANYILQQDGTIVKDGEGGLPDNLTLKIVSKESESGTEFDGTVYFIWNCDNKVCKSQIDGLIPGGRDGYTMNYIKASEIVDGTNKLNVSDITNDDYYWLWDDEFINSENLTTWSQLKEYMNDEQNLHTHGIDPCGSENGNNTITTNGGRVFRATIYDEEKYESISFGKNSNDYTYFPEFWDEVFFSSVVDISNTTKEKPAQYETYLLEKTIKFKKGENSKYDISSVKALVDNEKAVSVKEVNDTFEVTFNSNFYDKVTLELTDVQGNKYYVNICRTVMQVHDNFGPGISEAPLTAEIYYPSNKSYNDFEVYATISYKNGTSKIVKANSVKLIDRFDGTILGYEAEGGNELKKAAFEVDVDENVETVSFTVNYKSNSNDKFAGTFAGSGKGVTYNIEERKIIYE